MVYPSRRAAAIVTFIGEIAGHDGRGANFPALVVLSNTNRESLSSKVTVKGGYNIGSDGPEDGSIYIVHVEPQGTAILLF